MPKRKVNKIIQELNKLIKEKFPDLKGLYLYGSQAKGSWHKNSDIDVVAVFDEVTYDKTDEVIEIICDLDHKYNAYIDLRAYTMTELRENPYYYDEVINKGVYYAAV